MPSCAGNGCTVLYIQKLDDIFVQSYSDLFTDKLAAAQGRGDPAVPRDRCGLCPGGNARGCRMKRLKTFFARCGAVPAACYILAVAVWLVLSLAHAGSDALAKAQGRMTEQIIPVQSWQLVGLEPAEEQATAESALTLTTTNGDRR